MTEYLKGSAKGPVGGPIYDMHLTKPDRKQEALRRAVLTRMRSIGTMSTE